MFFTILVTVVLVLSAMTSGDESVTLFSQTNYDGDSRVFPLNPGCNLIRDGWNDKAGSVQLSGQDQCIILWEHYYCQGHSARISHRNAEDAKDLKNVDLEGKLSAIQLCDAGKCTKEGFFVDPGNCNKFFRCVDIYQTGENLVRYDFTCPVGLVFDEGLSTCNNPDQIDPPTPCEGEK